MDCIAYNLIDSGRSIVYNCVPSSEPIRIQWIVPNPWAHKRPLWDTKQDRVVIMGKRSVKEEVGMEVGSNGRKVREAGQRVTRMHYIHV